MVCPFLIKNNRKWTNLTKFDKKIPNSKFGIFLSSLQPDGVNLWNLKELDFAKFIIGNYTKGIRPLIAVIKIRKCYFFLMHYNTRKNPGGGGVFLINRRYLFAALTFAFLSELLSKHCVLCTVLCIIQNWKHFAVFYTENALVSCLQRFLQLTWKACSHVRFLPIISLYFSLIAQKIERITAGCLYVCM